MHERLMTYAVYIPLPAGIKNSAPSSPHDANLTGLLSVHLCYLPRMKPNYHLCFPFLRVQSA